MMTESVSDCGTLSTADAETPVSATASASTAESAPSGKKPQLTGTVLFVLACIDLFDCMNISLLMPYVVHMVASILEQPKDSTEVLRNVGLLVGVYNLAEMVFAPFWGLMSSRFGRRPVLLFGFAGVAIMPLFFGSATTLEWAFAARALNGVFCGNLSITKTYLGELVDESNEAHSFSILAFTFGLSMVVGPLLGGLLVYPADWAPGIFQDTIFERLPFLLPNLVFSVLASAVWLLAAALLKETLPPQKRRPFFQRGANAGSALTTNAGPRERESWGHWLQHSAPIFSYPGALRRCMLARALAVGMSVCASQAFVLLVQLPREVNGFNLSAEATGVLQNCAGAGLLITQVFVFTRAAKSMGYGWCITAGMTLVVAVTLPFPLYGLMADPATFGFWRYLPLGAMMFFLESGLCLVVPTTIIWTQRHAANVDRGLMNGLADSTAALCRALAPSVASGLLALGLESGLPLGRYLPWLAVAAAAAAIVGLARPVVVPEATELGTKAELELENGKKPELDLEGSKTEAQANGMEEADLERP